MCNMNSHYFGSFFQQPLFPQTLIISSKNKVPGDIYFDLFYINKIGHMALTSMHTYGLKRKT